MYLSDIFTVPANLVGLPGIALPSGFDARGLPLSLQLLAKPFDEATLLRAARAFEVATQWRCAPTFRGAPAGAVPALRPGAGAMRSPVDGPGTEGRPDRPSRARARAVAIVLLLIALPGTLHGASRRAKVGTGLTAVLAGEKLYLEGRAARGRERGRARSPGLGREGRRRPVRQGEWRCPSAASRSRLSRSVRHAQPAAPGRDAPGDLLP
jgi:hypothetical protein